MRNCQKIAKEHLHYTLSRTQFCYSCCLIGDGTSEIGIDRWKRWSNVYYKIRDNHEKSRIRAESCKRIFLLKIIRGIDS